jgi:serine/threonine protein phosphatase PrpC
MIASFFFHNSRYTAPREDALTADTERKVFAAADGVTRDWDAIQSGAAAYPNPSPATDAADAASAAILDTLTEAAPTEGSMRRALEAANAAVHAVNVRWNLFERCDYLENDLGGAVASAAWVSGNRLLTGWIGDCGVAVVRNGTLSWITRDQLDDVTAHLKEHPGQYDDARRVWTRRELRNKPGLLEDGRPVTYGVLTGEPEAAAYIETSALELRAGDVVATHTDGFRPYFANDDFLSLLSGDPERWQEGIPALSEALAGHSDAFGKERSVWLYKHT